METNKLDPCSPQLTERIFAFEKIWETREEYLPGAYASIFKEDDYWDPLLHKEFASQHGWTRLGNA